MSIVLSYIVAGLKAFIAVSGVVLGFLAIPAGLIFLFIAVNRIRR